jgi:hypothetical protein
MESWISMNNLVFVAARVRLIFFFPNLQKMYIMCRESETLRHVIHWLSVLLPDKFHYSPESDFRIQIQIHY